MLKKCKKIITHLIGVSSYSLANITTKKIWTMPNLRLSLCITISHWELLSLKSQYLFSSPQCCDRTQMGSKCTSLFFLLQNASIPCDLHLC